jgi:transposase
MNMFTDVTEVYLHRKPVDLRKSIDGLMIIAEQQMQLSPFGGALFVFCNRARDKVKILYWDKTGFALWYKRLEKHRFKWPVKSNRDTVELSEQQLHWLLGGYDVLGHEPLHYKASGL